MEGVCWCGGRNTDPNKAGLVSIISFLQNLLESKLSYSTIRGYVEAISACHSDYETCSLCMVKEVKDFLKGVFWLNPPIKEIVPHWDLGIVLQALGNDGPFEPPDKASLQAWTWKTVFLLAIMSAARVSDLQDRHKASLRLNLAFLPKVPNQ